MSYQLTKPERQKVALCQQIEADPAATAVQKIAAIEKRERILNSAQKRAAKAVQERPAPSKAEPDLDTLMAELAERAKPAEPVVSPAIQSEPPSPSDESEARKSSLLERDEKEPLKTKDLNINEIVTTEALPFQFLSPDEILRRQAKAAWYAQTGTTLPPNDGLTDLQRSQRIWQEQAAADHEERARLIRDLEYEQRRNSF